MNRRCFLNFGAAAVGFSRNGYSFAPKTRASEMASDVVIIGGGTGGFSAALAAARHLEVRFAKDGT